MPKNKAMMSDQIANHICALFDIDTDQLNKLEITLEVNQPVTIKATYFSGIEEKDGINLLKNTMKEYELTERSSQEASSPQ